MGLLGLKKAGGLQLIKLFILAITIILISSYTVFPITHINAEEVDSIHTGDTLKLFVEKFGRYKDETNLLDFHFFNGIEVNSPMTRFEKTDNSLTISTEEKNLLARLVHAEAKGESYEGKVAVAAVVLNRVEHKEFPDTIKDVIYEKNAFEPVQNGSIHESADEEAHKAVQEALESQGNDDEMLYFYNPETATSDWIFSRKVIKTIGNHAFAI